jgi:hypothetical protein
MSSGNDQTDVIGSDMSDDDRNLLRLWRDSQTFLDQRYRSKELLKLVARAMTDEEFRARLVDDTAGVAGPGGPAETVRFFANTPTTLNVVLPPPAGEAATRSGALRDALRSRTSGDALFFLEDDWNISDPDTKDGTIVVIPPEDDAGVPNRE